MDVDVKISSSQMMQRRKAVQPNAPSRLWEVWQNRSFEFMLIVNFFRVSERCKHVINVMLDHAFEP